MNKINRDEFIKYDKKTHTWKAPSGCCPPYIKNAVVNGQGGQGGQDNPTSHLTGLCQYASTDGIKYFPSGVTVPSLEPGVYSIKFDVQRGIFFTQIPIKTDGLIHFPETNSELVTEEIKKFWDRREIFAKHGLTHKRGIVLYGPPGSGKSSTIQLVMRDVISRGGVVFKFDMPSTYSEGVRIFRQIQPDTPVVCLMEDIDSLIRTHDESQILNILDGVDQIDRVVYLATTNHPGMLGERILNRPSRFDKRFEMGHPKEESRRIYFEHLCDEETIKKCDIDFDQWVEDTDGMSIAHLKELFISVVILGNKYKEALSVIREMIEIRPRSLESSNESFGFFGG